MAICSYFLAGRCRYGDRCWNEHPRGGRRPEQSRYHYQQPTAASKTWTSSNQRYVQPSSFPKSTTWTKDANQATFASHADPHDSRSRSYNSGSSAGLFSSQNRFSTLPSQDQSRDTQSDKDGSLAEDIKHDLEAWESSGQWIFSAYCVVKDARNITGFSDISPEELRLEFYTARDSGNIQNYVNSIQQLVSRWKQRIHEIKNTNFPSQTALMNELTKPAVNSVPTFAGQQNSSFSTTGSSASSAAQAAVNFSFKSDSQFSAPTAPIHSFPGASGFANKPATVVSNTVAGSAASFTFAVTTASDGASSGFSNAKPLTASSFSFTPTASASSFSGFAAATTAVPASTLSSTATTGFVGTTAASGFGQGVTSSFGSASGFGVPAGNTVTSGFGAKTSAVSDLFRTGAASSTTSVPLGQASGFSLSRAPSATTTADTGNKNPIFTQQSELSATELSQFEAKKFTLGNVPLRPPPANLLIV